jgi:hypothetical protein
VALSTNNQLLAFDSSSPGTIQTRGAITGLQTGESILGIDFRPSTGQLYGLGSSNRLYVISTSTGAATPVGTGTFAVPLSGTAFGFNFDPAADQIRVISNTGQNLRLDPTTGAEIDSDPNTPGTQLDTNLPSSAHVVAVAYTNNSPGAASTTLYGIDSASQMFVQIGGTDGNPSPNLGSVTPVAPLGASTSDQASFDIGSDNLGYAALTVNGTAQLVQVSLATGPSPVGPIGDGTVGVRGLSIAIPPPPPPPPPPPTTPPLAGTRPSPSALFAVTSSDELLVLNSATPGTIAHATPITGLQSGESILGIDVRPATGQLYALGSSNRLYTLDPATGAARQVGSGTFAVPLLGVAFGFNFDPVADQIRVVSDADQNLRLDPNTGAVIDGDPSTSGTQTDSWLSATYTVGLGYTNAVAGAKATTAYGIDGLNGWLVMVGGPNGNPSPSLGQVTQVGPLGVTIDWTPVPAAPFDISPAGTPFTALQIGGQDSLFAINLTTGAATALGPIGTGTDKIVGLAAAPPELLALAPTGTSEPASAGSFQITVVRTGSTAGQVTVDYGTADGTALAGQDYAPTAGTLVFPPGAASETVTIPILRDTPNTGPRMFGLGLGNPTGGASLGNPSTTVLTILESGSTPPALSINSVSVAEPSAGTTNAVFTVTLSAPSTQTVTVPVTTAGGTATPGVDFLGGSGVLTFAPGVTTQPVTVPVLADPATDGSETFTVNLGTPTNATLDQATGTGTILDTAGPPLLPALSINSVSVTEPTSGTTNAVFTVTLSAPSAQTVTVPVATAGGTATPGVDFMGGSGVLTFAPGMTTQTVPVPVLADPTPDGDETFTVNLGTPTGAIVTPGAGTGIGTIHDAAGPPALPALSINSVTVTEPTSGTTNAVFTVTLSAPSTQTVTVPVTTAGGTATPGVDFLSGSGVLTFAPGVTTQTVPVPVLADATPDGAETFTVNLGTPTNATVAQATGTGTILDAGVPLVPALSINSVTVTEPSAGTASAFFTVMLSIPTTQTVTVPVTTAGGTAAPGVDFQPVNTVLTFTPGVATQTVAVPVLADPAADGDETFTVNLGTPTNATLAQATGIGTIHDVNAPPSPLPPGLPSGPSATVFALNAAGTQLLAFNSAAPQAVLGATPLIGLGAGEAVQDIDFRPSTGQLYGLAVAGTTARLVIINPATGQLTQVCQPFPVTASAGSGFGIDFDPTSDQLRIIDSQGDDLVMNPDTGGIVSQARLSSSHVVGAAYDDNVAGATTTTLFGIDTTTDSLVSLTPAVSGTAHTVGPLGVAPLPSPVGFDIASNGTAFAALTTGTTSGLYAINLQTGAATLVGAVGAPGGIGGIAVAPARVQFSAPTYTGPEGGAATITVTRLDNTLGSVIVHYSADSGTATAMTDFTPVGGVLIFAPGETAKTFTVPLLGDARVDGNETVQLTLSSPTSGALLGVPNTAVLTIVDGPTTAVLEVTSLVSVSVGPARFVPATGRFRKKITVRNTGADPIRGPLALVLDHLPRKVRLRRATGFTRTLAPLGSPVVDFVPPGGVLNPGQSVTLTLEFVNPQRRRLNFTTRVLANPD